MNPPENVFYLKEDCLPDTTDADPNGKIMVFRHDMGWSVIEQENAKVFLKNLKFTHWTYTPDRPYD